MKNIYWGNVGFLCCFQIICFNILDIIKVTYLAPKIVSLFGVPQPLWQYMLDSIFIPRTHASRRLG